jgi:hypothetical protein
MHWPPFAGHADDAGRASAFAAMAKRPSLEAGPAHP